MEISGNNSRVNLVDYVKRANEYNQQDLNKTADRAQQSTSGGDKVELSNKAIEINSLFETARKIPEIREDKVNEIQRQVETGTYPIEPEKIATSMLKETLQNNAILNAMNM